MVTYAHANVNNIRLHYASEGAGSLILFLRDHLGVAPDMRGYHLSDKPTDVEQ